MIILCLLFSTYNADFDGDEMNVHFPQDEISRAEAINIVDANKQYIGPRSGDAVRGLIQVCICSCCILFFRMFTMEHLGCVW
jgi:DNA-directed RNA polymerase I subunit RPA1